MFRAVGVGRSEGQSVRHGSFQRERPSRSVGEIVREVEVDGIALVSRAGQPLPVQFFFRPHQ